MEDESWTGCRAEAHIELAGVGTDGSAAVHSGVTLHCSHCAHCNLYTLQLAGASVES